MFDRETTASRWDAGRHTSPLRERVRSTEQIIREIAPFREPILRQHHKLLAMFGAVMTVLRVLATDIQLFMRQAYRVEISNPHFPSAGLEITSLSFEEAYRELCLRYEAAVRKVAGMFQCKFVGQTEWIDRDTVRFSYILVQEERHLLTLKSHRTRHTHELVKALEHPLDEAGTPMDQRTQQLAAILPPKIKPYARIITGLQIQQHQEHAGTDESLTALGRFVHGTGRAAGDATRAVGRAVASIDPKAAGIVAGGVGLAGLGIAALNFLASAAATVGTAVAIADPCLTIGEYCLHGWE